MTRRARLGALLALVAAVSMAATASSMAFTKFVAKEKSTIQGKAVTPQKIKTSFGVVECTKFTGIEEGVEKEDSETGKSKDKNEGCTFTAAKGETKESAVVSEDEIGASDKSDGSETDKLTTVESTNCKVIIGSGDKQGESVVFKDTEKPVGDLLAKSTTKGVKYTGSGSLCTGEGSNGEFEGTTEAFDPTGTIGVSEGNFVTDTKGTVKSKAVESQVFETSFGVIKCPVVSNKGTTEHEKTETNKQAIKLEKCVFGEASVVFSEIKELFNANGTIEIESPITVEFAGCVITVPSGQKFAEAATYENNGSNLKVKVRVKGFSYEGKGTLCKGSNTNGVAVDSEEIEGNKPPEKINVE